MTMMFTPSASSLKCHEGFNFTVGRIPFYFWTENQCEAGDICVIQEYIYGSGKQYSEIAFRFGGCVSVGVKEFFKCRRAREEPLLTMKVAKDIFRGLDRKLSRFATDITTNEKRFWKKYLSRGKDISEFIDGIFQFLSAIGYDEYKFKSPLHDFAHDVMERDIPAAMMSGYSLLKSLKSENPAARRLSKTLREYMKQFHDAKKPSTISQVIVDAIPRVMYPVFANTIPDLERSFNDISDGIELGFAEINEENFSLLLFCMTIIQSLITEISPDETYFATEALKEIVTVHLPESPSVDLETHIFDTLNSFLKKTSTKCSHHDANCIQRRLRAHIEFHSLPFEYRRKVSTYYKTEVPQTDKFMDSVNQLLMAYVIALSETLEYSAQPISGKHYDAMFPKIKNHLQTVIDILNDPNEEIPGWFCQDYHCASNLCNSHHYLIIAGKSGHAAKTEL